MPARKSYAPSRRTVRRVAKKVAKCPTWLLVVLAVAVVTVAVLYFSGTLSGFLDPGPGLPLSSTSDLPPAGPVTGTVEVHMIDVGQGDAILIRTDAGDMLIDTGDNTNASRNAVKSYLREQGVTSLEWLVLTHPDADHIGGASMILTTYPVEKVLLSDYTKTTKLYNNMISAIIASDAEVHVVEMDDTLSTDPDVGAVIRHAGDTFSLGQVQFKILGPIENPTGNNTNNASVVLRMAFGANSVLFTGDMESENNDEIDDLIAAFPSDLRCDILKSGHHGSHNANNAALLSAVRPAYALISVGEGNEYGHPHLQTLDLYDEWGVTVYRTDFVGWIVCVSDGTSWTVTTQRTPE